MSDSKAHKRPRENSTAEILGGVALCLGAGVPYLHALGKLVHSIWPHMH
ncbi:hypothetical protein [Acidipila sp. EB88]|nr:hypothetical protein [Acidipila sp. EB88]